MIKLLILQNLVPHYRKPVYNELSKYYDVTVLHSGKKSVEENDYYKEIVVPSRSIGPFILQSGIMNGVRKGQYDVVIAMADLHWICNFIVHFFAKHVRFLYWGHRYSKYPFINILRDYFIRISDGVILYSEGEVKKMLSRGIPASKIFIAHNTMHVPNHSDGSGVPKDSFIFSGRAQKRKKIDVLIRAFKEVLGRIPDNTKINIIGAGDENDNLKNLTEHLGLSDRVIFRGEIADHAKLKHYFQKAYAYVSPGPVGLGVLHSFAYGVPVVTHYCEKHGPEFDNLVNGENALLYNTYEELKEILVSLCKDKELSKRLGQNSYKKYSEERNIHKMVASFRNAIENIRIY